MDNRKGVLNYSTHPMTACSLNAALLNSLKTPTDAFPWVPSSLSPSGLSTLPMASKGVSHDVSHAHMTSQSDTNRRKLEKQQESYRQTLLSHLLLDHQDKSHTMKDPVALAAEQEGLDIKTHLQMKDSTLLDVYKREDDKKCAKTSFTQAVEKLKRKQSTWPMKQGLGYHLAQDTDKNAHFTTPSFLHLMNPTEKQVANPYVKPLVDKQVAHSLDTSSHHATDPSKPMLNVNNKGAISSCRLLLMNQLLTQMHPPPTIKNEPKVLDPVPVDPFIKDEFILNSPFYSPDVSRPSVDSMRIKLPEMPQPFSPRSIYYKAPETPVQPVLPFIRPSLPASVYRIMTEKPVQWQCPDATIRTKPTQLTPAMIYVNTDSIDPSKALRLFCMHQQPKRWKTWITYDEIITHTTLKTPTKVSLALMKKRKRVASTQGLDAEDMPETKALKLPEQRSPIRREPSEPPNETSSTTKTMYSATLLVIFPEDHLAFKSIPCATKEEAQRYVCMKALEILQVVINVIPNLTEKTVLKRPLDQEEDALDSTLSQLAKKHKSS